MKERETIQHYRTSGNTAPNAENLKEGELALNISTGETAIYMKDVENKIHTFKDSAYNNDRYVVNGENEKDVTITRNGEDGEAAQIAVSTDGVNLTVSPSDGLANTQISIENKNISISSTMDGAGGSAKEISTISLGIDGGETSLYNKKDDGYGKISFETISVGNPYAVHRAGVYTTLSTKVWPRKAISGEIATHIDLFKIKKSLGSKKTKDKMEPNVSHATSQSPFVRFGDCVFCSPKAKNYYCENYSTDNGEHISQSSHLDGSTNGKILYELNKKDSYIGNDNTSSVNLAYYFYWDSAKKGYYIHISNSIYSHFNGNDGIVVITGKDRTTSVLYTFPDREDKDITIFYKGKFETATKFVNKTVSIYVLCEPSSFYGGEAGCVLWNKGSDISYYKGTKRDNGAKNTETYDREYYSGRNFKRANIDRRTIGRWVKVKRHQKMFRVIHDGKITHMEEWAPQATEATLLPERLKGVLKINDFASMICNQEDRQYQVYYRVSGKNNKKMKWRPFCKNNAGIALNNIREYWLIKILSRSSVDNTLCLIDYAGNVLEENVTRGQNKVLYRLVDEDDGGQFYTVAFYYSDAVCGTEKFHEAKRLIGNASAENLYTKDEYGKYVKCAEGDVVEDGITYYECNYFYDFPDWFGEAEQKAIEAEYNGTWNNNNDGYQINGKEDCEIQYLDVDKITKYICSLFDKYPISFTNTHRNRYIDFAIFEVTRSGKNKINYAGDTRYRCKAVCKPIGLLYRLNASVGDYNGKYNVKSVMQQIGTINYFMVPR